MIPILLSIGWLQIKSYGFFVALGLLVGITLLNKDPKVRSTLSYQEIEFFLFGAIVSALLGGRILFALLHFSTVADWLEIYKIWQGGLSLQGAYIALPIWTYIFCRQKHISFLQFADRIALYGCLTQAIARIGCFFAGCCHGSQAPQTFFSVTYTHPESLGILGVPLHPSQLYSSVSLFALFLVFYFYVQYHTKPGQMVSLYSMSASLERLINDFIRWEYQPYHLAGISIFSLQQWIALTLCFLGLGLYLKLQYQKRI